jgi:hypothetical protein
VAESLINNTNLISNGAYDEKTKDSLSDLTNVLANSIDEEIEKLKTIVPEAITLIREQVV